MKNRELSAISFFQDVIDGNIIQMTDKVIEVLKSKYLISPIHYEGLQRIESLEIPEDALREAIFNSIIHKDYTGVHIQMKVYNDRVMLWNEGNLPEGYTVETLMGEHSSKPLNRNIANAFYKAGFIEAWGHGQRFFLKTIRHENEAKRLPSPFFIRWYFIDNFILSLSIVFLIGYCQHQKCHKQGEQYCLFLVF